MPVSQGLEVSRQNLSELGVKGQKRIRIAEATGSNPVVSTIVKCKPCKDLRDFLFSLYMGIIARWCAISYSTSLLNGFKFLPISFLGIPKND